MNQLITKIPASLRNYTLNIAPASEETFSIQGKTIRLLNANVPISFVSEDGMLGFTLSSGDEAVFEEAIFYRFRIFHADPSAQNIVISVGNGGRIGSAKLNGTVSVSGAIALDAPTLAALESISVHSDGQVYGASHRSIALLAANTAEVVFTPGSNVNGALLHSAQFMSGHGTIITNGALLAKTSTPTTVTDGDAVLGADCCSLVGGFVVVAGSLKSPIKIPAGKGLYYISTLLETAGSSRSALYTLL